MFSTFSVTLLFKHSQFPKTPSNHHITTLSISSIYLLICLKFIRHFFWIIFPSVWKIIFLFWFFFVFFPKWSKANARIQMVRFTLSADLIMLLLACICGLKLFVILCNTDRNANRKACISSYVSHQHFRRQVTFFAACSSSTPSPITTYTTFLPNLCIIRSKQLSFPGR